MLRMIFSTRVNFHKPSFYRFRYDCGISIEHKKAFEQWMDLKF